MSEEFGVIERREHVIEVRCPEKIGQQTVDPLERRRFTRMGFGSRIVSHR